MKTAKARGCGTKLPYHQRVHFLDWRYGDPRPVCPDCLSQQHMEKDTSSGKWVCKKGKPMHVFQFLTKRPKRMAELWSLWKKESDEAEYYLKNFWLGGTVVNQDEADRVAPVLASIDCAVKFLSIEPMLGPVDVPLDGIDWVIVGGETGPGARRMDPAWAKDIKNQCAQARVPFFFKGWGTNLWPKSDKFYRLIEGKEWNQFPEGKS